MKFIDKAKIEIIAGKGGNGIISFRREAKVPRGGPDGGDGGKGGSIYFVGDKGNNTLLNVSSKHKINGNDGVDGKSKKMHGAWGKDVFIKVPFGTVVYNNKEIIADIIKDTPYLIAKGGKGGKGNTRFKSSVNKAPMICENGLPGENFIAKLELKILADIGFVGLPSAGKSTLLSKISNARPKIGNYDFTTLSPQLGLVKVNKESSFVAADLPGLIKGASQGRGLGHEFLKHIERCRVIAHIVDFGNPDANQVENYRTINNELKLHLLNLEKRPQVLIANKSDQEDFQKNIAKFKNDYPDLNIIEVSALTEVNLQKVKYELWKVFSNLDNVSVDSKVDEVIITLNDDIQVRKINHNTFDVFGSRVKLIYDLIPLNSHENFLRFNKKLKNIGVWDKLKKENIKVGDNVKIFKHIFSWGENNED